MSDTRKQKRRPGPLDELPAGITIHPRGGLRVVASRTVAGKRERSVRVVRRNPGESDRDYVRRATREQSRLLDELDDELAAGSATSLAGICRARADDRELAGKAPSYVAELRRKSELLAETALGRRPASQVEPGELSALYARLKRDGLGDSGVRAWHALISGAYSLAVACGELDRNPAKSATRPAAPRPRGIAPEPELARRYLDAVERKVPSLGSLLRLAALTGARRGELCALRWSDVDIERGTMNVWRNGTSPKGERFAEGDTKNGRRRTAPLSEDAVAELVAHRARREALCLAAEVELDPRGFVFGPDTYPHGSRPFRPDYVSRRSREIAVDAGLPLAACHPHGLRHFYATHALGTPESDAKSIADGLGMDPAIMLSTYAHGTGASKRAGASAVAAALGR